jgi:hypothetical protein
MVSIFDAIESPPSVMPETFLAARPGASRTMRDQQISPTLTASATRRRRGAKLASANRPSSATKKRKKPC